MNRMLRAAVAAAATVLVASALGGCAFLTPAEQFRDTTTVEDAIATIQIADNQGSVTVRGVEGATQTTVARQVSYRGERPEGETHAVEGDTLELRGCGRRCSVDYTIDVPAGVDVRGQTSNGAIKLSAVGAVEVGTSNGRIELEDVQGAVDVETSNGRIEGEGLNGDGIRAETSNGAIDLELGTPQDVEARTSNGSIELSVPADSYRITTETSNGGTDIGVANDPDGRFTLDLRTSNGSITVEED
ncbi:DUF4097 family beta strand repeat-containing protein [Agromyces mariniharenae]|uniref:DUF4097 family beta strand repeat protein n=1 Tax=Agromyces mariniharenae TaxID=2604423 RepID=A0A5S4V2N2_9MICO|nr:DUF4097 family beta strand repeat-containing protein [Agromyces mariniharenae]TYL53387.1 DUF4097 family beta strand repeat protein [Agromyces mariniharenae]